MWGTEWEDRWQLLVCKALREAVLTACHGSTGTAISGCPKHSAVFAKGSTDTSTEGTWRTSHTDVMPVQPITLLMSLMLNFSSRL